MKQQVNFLDFESVFILKNNLLVTLPTDIPIIGPMPTASKDLRRMVIILLSKLYIYIIFLPSPAVGGEVEGDTVMTAGVDIRTGRVDTMTTVLS